MKESAKPGGKAGNKCNCKSGTIRALQLRLCDQVNSNTSAYPANVGGNYNANANYGLFYFNANNAASNTNANLGSRNIFELWKITNCADSSMALAKNIAVKAELSRGLEKL